MNCFFDLTTGHCGDVNTGFFAPVAGEFTVRIFQNGAYSTQTVVIDELEEFVLQGEWFNEATVAEVDFFDFDGAAVIPYDSEIVLLEAPLKLRVRVVPIYST